ncbi:hypothetical protein B1R32_10877 [Abditibacterium utsteinense]|uniref:Uncharacterized protein n=1 Tax=Abditibacterium utsteinense TaxID=1960156 RepID=A0A2S8SST9_9BACT|nr:hypothetical protein B1R32_10877 [Abditibacterium utsteinense]
MSRSRRKTPVCGNCVCRSERSEKISWHRKMRREIASRLRQSEEVLMPLDKEVSDIWDFGKDGKRRFDPQQFPQEMRK